MRHAQVYTADQVATIRRILINKSREAQMKVGERFVCDGQEDDDMMMFNTQSGVSMFVYARQSAPCATVHGSADNTGLPSFLHTGNEIIFGIPKAVTKALKKASPAQRFDALFGLTYALNEYDCWMHDNECYEKGGDCEKAVKRLAKAWKDLLPMSDADLGIDAEFTRPGIEALLGKFAAALADIERGDESGYKFVWK